MNMNLYREDILDHAKHPLNFGNLINCDVVDSCKNMSCGDNIQVQLKIINNKIEDISWQGQGCTVSMATMSILSEYVKGKEIIEIEKYDIKTINFLFGSEVNFGRIKCATLGLKSLQQAIKKYEKK